MPAQSNTEESQITNKNQKGWFTPITTAYNLVKQTADQAKTWAIKKITPTSTTTLKGQKKPASFTASSKGTSSAQEDDPEILALREQFYKNLMLIGALKNSNLIPNQATIQQSNEFCIGNKDDALGCIVAYKKEAVDFCLLSDKDESKSIFADTVDAYIRAHNATYKNDPLIFDLTVQSEEDAKNYLKYFEKNKDLKICNVIIKNASGKKILEEKDIEALRADQPAAQASSSAPRP